MTEVLLLGKLDRNVPLCVQTWNNGMKQWPSVLPLGGWSCHLLQMLCTYHPSSKEAGRTVACLHRIPWDFPEILHGNRWSFLATKDEAPKMLHLPLLKRPRFVFFYSFWRHFAGGSEMVGPSRLRPVNGFWLTRNNWEKTSKVHAETFTSWWTTQSEHHLFHVVSM